MNSLMRTAAHHLCCNEATIQSTKSYCFLIVSSTFLTSQANLICEKLVAACEAVMPTRIATYQKELYSSHGDFYLNLD